MQLGLLQCPGARIELHFYIPTPDFLSYIDNQYTRYDSQILQAEISMTYLSIKKQFLLQFVSGFTFFHEQRPTQENITNSIPITGSI